MDLSILYRGPLSSCNYGCPYCPFAKHIETREEHERDEAALKRFINFIKQNDKIAFSIFFTPWGEALIHPRYQQAFVDLTNLSNVVKVAVQTNLSCKLDWLNECNRKKVGIWATYHPGEVEVSKFLKQCSRLSAQSINYSVGIVGLKENLDAIRAMRKALPEPVYLWVNAFKREANYYSKSEIAELSEIDPLFEINNQYHKSEGKICRTGKDVISVDGDGNIRRCHFIDTVIGNIYSDQLHTILRERSCSAKTCGCHIGYIYLNDLNLQAVFADGILERIPAQWPNTDYFPSKVLQTISKQAP